ncbi:MAG: hypothetical protein CBE08_000580 [Euryarchaeota archaeon TMED248]|nr:MAG: hypothetical protein CBE08_000580 [Euryarchaeota archaeon TMED248]|tara:strand:- start:672 stop:1349 length:678 start_codon:yes stop_codon:yes gene_type:complete
MGTELDIPAPVLEENKDEYLQEISEIAEAEDWIKKHSITTQPIEGVEPNIKTKNQVLKASHEVSNPINNIKSLFFVLSIMSLLIIYIFFIPADETADFFGYFLFYFIMIFAFYIFSPNNDEEQNQTIIIQEKDKLWNKPLIMFSTGFSIPFFFWIFQFSTLGEPCSVFCSGKELWDIYKALLANFIFCSLYFFSVLFSRSLPAWIFGIGLFVGSFFGMAVGEGIA